MNDDNDDYDDYDYNKTTNSCYWLLLENKS